METQSLQQITLKEIDLIEHRKEHVYKVHM